jgi:GDPmannose 4,6-dehydratase
MTTSLITGVTGQDGAYLTKLLLERGDKVFGTYRRSSSVNFWRLEALGVAAHPNLELVEFDLTDASTTIRLVDRCQPDRT